MPTVLLIDDDGLGLQVREYLFKTAGYEVIAATTAIAGLELFKTDEPDLVVLDLDLPDVHGSEALKIMRDHKPSVPVIVLSGIVWVPPEVLELAAAVIVKGEGAQRLLDEAARLTT